MQRERSYRAWCSALAIVMVAGAFSNAFANPKERIDFWRNNYVELTAADDPRVERAHDIFERILHAAGRTLGVVPRLFILKRDPMNIALPIAIPDGWVIISKGTLDICYRDPVYGDDRLAFVLAHELAHQLKGDFWHMQFFQALEASKSRGDQPRQTLEEIGLGLRRTDDIWAKELQADEHGIVYAAMAGFRTHAMITGDGQVNFFQEWVDALNPERVGAAYQGKSHPAPQQRVTAVKARLHQVVSKTDAFEIGLHFYQAGEYARAIRAFEKFLEYFPSREVYLNLAASHHQLALQLRQMQQPENRLLPFKLSLAVDPDTRARRITFRRTQRPQVRFQEHVDKAIGFYEMAKSLDPNYALSYNNLGCAYIVNGEPFKAIATLQDGLKLSPDAPEMLNNLGAAFFQANLADLAKSHLHKASILDANYAAPLFNLGKVAYEERQRGEARRHWRAYLRLDAVSPWAKLVRQYDKGLRSWAALRTLPQPADEHIKEVSVAMFEDEIPKAWGAPGSVRSLLLEEEPLTVRHYPQGIITFAQDEEIVMIFAEPVYRGKSARGVAIGSGQAKVIDQYSTPSRILKMTQGETWVYDKVGISFQLRQGRVVSWLLF
ncbi:tetratricopeptide repeat protein [Candidatus Entotheonella palauensis]|uniref:tetratricopeptide repeat protein n=1 Tax=Candidatus Entotheonella palauensis TaxID=93172 RepID=UPI0015C423B0|nr:tetratricopeptide repeat protein [Candidatus Entotheonella palauensis]